ncbi:hypothetical protein ACWG0Q_01945 [Actinacidiphila sp. SB3-2]
MRDTSTGTDAAGTPAGAPGGSRGDAVHEAYSFACMRCGHGWEQEYEIVHLEYTDGRPMVVYYAEGKRVPSPLKHPSCLNCENNVIRIMRAGRVSEAEAAHMHMPPMPM